METKDSSIEILIAKFLTGNISAEENAQLNTWLEQSAANKRYFSQLSNIWQTAHPAFNPEEIDEEKALAKVLLMLENKKHKHFKLSYWIQRVAAIMLIPLLLLSAYIIFEQHKTLNSDIVYQEVASPYGTSSKINLPDGSSVWLNSGSRLRYPVVFKTGARNVYLEGEGYFAVQSSPGNPFTVETNNLNVTATGTEFNVESYATDSFTSITLVKGIVSVKMDDKTINMHPNQKLSYYNKQQHEILNTDPYKWCAWKDGNLVFRDDRLDYVFKKIGQMYNADIKVMDAEIASHLYRATFEEETLDEILELLKLTAPLEYKKTEREKTEDGHFKRRKIEIYKAGHKKGT